MISPSKGRYEMLLLQPVGPSLPMTTYIQVNRRNTAHCKAQQCEPLSRTLGALRLAAELRLRHLLKTTLFLHVKLRQEALQKQKSSSFRTCLMDVEPIIGSRLFPQEATARLLDTFRDVAFNAKKATVSKRSNHAPKAPSNRKNDKQGKDKKSSYKSAQHSSTKKQTSQFQQPSTSFRSIGAKAIIQQKE